MSPAVGGVEGISADVAVLGGGPAGLAAATALARHGHSVVVVERTSYGRPRAGESLGGEVRPLLAALGICDQPELLSPVRFLSVSSAWGFSELASHSSITNPFGEGWHVDRARFDAMLADHAARSGALVRMAAGRCAVARGSDAWVIYGDGFVVQARYLVDASGRGAPATRPFLPQRRWIAFDRMVGIVGRVRPPADSAIEPVLLLEAVAEGWWYTAPQPDGTLLVTLMTDRDLLGAHSRDELKVHWRSSLACTTHTAGRISRCEIGGDIAVFGAESGRLVPDRGPGWRAVGDAAMACDPLAGNGVARALRSGLDAAAEIRRLLTGAPETGSADNHAFGRYLARRARYYGQERRWPRSLFWARRHPVDWESVNIALDPAAVLTSSSRTPSRDCLAPVEALLPYGVIQDLLALLRPGLPAHRALAFLRERAPLPDRQLLVGLQLLADPTRPTCAGPGRANLNRRPDAA